jgi:hypothetical protein
MEQDMEFNDNYTLSSGERTLARTASGESR